MKTGAGSCTLTWDVPKELMSSKIIKFLININFRKKEEKKAKDLNFRCTKIMHMSIFDRLVTKSCINDYYKTL